MTHIKLSGWQFVPENNTKAPLPDVVHLKKYHGRTCEVRLDCSQSVSVLACDWCSPVFDKGLEVEGEAHAERQQRRIFLQHFGQNFKVCLAVLVGELSRGELHLEGTS